MCFDAPKHGNDIPEMNRLLRRVNDRSDGVQQRRCGGNFISKESSPRWTSTRRASTTRWAWRPAPAERQEGRRRAHRRKPLGMPGPMSTVPPPGDSAAKATMREVCATHMNMKLPPTAREPQGPGECAAPDQDLFDNGGYQFSSTC